MTAQLVRTACLLLAAAGVGAQQTWKVSCSDPNAHFTDLPPAVAAAAPGDTILVYHVLGGTGTCANNHYTAPLIDKPLRIVGFFAGLPPGNNYPTKAEIRGPLHVANIAAGQQVLMSNVVLKHEVLSPPWGTGGVGSPITIADCAGSVLIEDLFFRNGGTPGQVIEVTRCDHVVLRGCTFEVGGAPIRIVDSKVLLSSTLVRPIPPSSITPYTVSTETLFLQRSRVELVGSIVEATGDWGLQPARPAARMDDSTIRVGASSLLRGGLYAGSIPPLQPSDFTPAYQFITPAPSSVEKDPRAPVFNYFPATPPTITAVDETFHDWIVADEYYQVRVIGPAGGFALLAVGDMCFPTASPLGTLGLDPSTLLLLDVVPLSAAAGVHSWVLHCPNTIPNGVAYAFQSLTVSSAGVLGVTAPSPLIVAWEKDRFP